MIIPVILGADLLSLGCVEMWLLQELFFQLRCSFWNPNDQKLVLPSNMRFSINRKFFLGGPRLKGPKWVLSQVTIFSFLPP